MSPQNPDWFVADGREQHAKYSEADLQRAIRAGAVPGHMLVWRRGMSNWLPVKEVAAFADALSDPAGVPPPFPVQAPAAPAPLKAPALLPDRQTSSSATLNTSAEALGQRQAQREIAQPKVQTPATVEAEARTTEWHLQQAGQPARRLSEESLAQSVRAGTVARTDLVWRRGIGEWVQADQVENLAPLFAPVVRKVSSPAVGKLLHTSTSKGAERRAFGVASELEGATLVSDVVPPPKTAAPQLGKPPGSQRQRQERDLTPRPPEQAFELNVERAQKNRWPLRLGAIGAAALGVLGLAFALIGPRAGGLTAHPKAAESDQGTVLASPTPAQPGPTKDPGTAAVSAQLKATFESGASIQADAGTLPGAVAEKQQQAAAQDASSTRSQEASVPPGGAAGLGDAAARPKDSTTGALSPCGSIVGAGASAYWKSLEPERTVPCAELKAKDEKDEFERRTLANCLKENRLEIQEAVRANRNAIHHVKIEPKLGTYNFAKSTYQLLFEGDGDVAFTTPSVVPLRGGGEVLAYSWESKPLKVAWPLAAAEAQEAKKRFDAELVSADSLEACVGFRLGRHMNHNMKVWYADVGRFVDGGAGEVDVATDIKVIVRRHSDGKVVLDTAAEASSGDGAVSGAKANPGAVPNAGQAFKKKKRCAPKECDQKFYACRHACVGHDIGYLGGCYGVTSACERRCW